MTKQNLISRIFKKTIASGLVASAIAIGGCAQIDNRFGLVPEIKFDTDGRLINSYEDNTSILSFEFFSKNYGIYQPFDSNGDGFIDGISKTEKESFNSSIVSRRLFDNNLDGFVDKIWIYNSKGKIIQKIFYNKSGIPKIVRDYNENSELIKEEKYYDDDKPNIIIKYDHKNDREIIEFRI